MARRAPITPWPRGCARAQRIRALEDLKAWEARRACGRGHALATAGQAPHEDAPALTGGQR